MKKWKWPDEVIEWLRVNVPGKTMKQVTELINRQGFDKKYNMVFSIASIKCAKSRYHIQSGTKPGFSKGYSPKFPEKMETYIRSIATGRGTEEIARMVSEHFGIEFTTRQCRAYKKNHNIVSGLDCRFQEGQTPANKGKKMSKEVYERCRATMFKKGNIPANHLEIGEYSHTTDGYLIRKVKETGQQRERFEFVHRAVWEEHNGPIPKGKMVIFLDGNKDNCDISNLALVDNSENLEMNRRRLRFADPERTKAGLMVSKLRVAAKQRQKN